jgi:hypothetical protein
MRLLFLLWLVTFQIIAFTAVEFCEAGTWRDDFEDAITTEWTIYNLNRQVEKWWVDKGEAVGQIFQSGFMSLWLTGDLNWKNYSLSCRAKLVKEKNDPASLGFTLYDRGDEDMRYLFFVNFTLGTVSIVKATPDAWFIRNFPFVAELDTWYEFKAIVDNELLEFRINDEIFTGRDLEPFKSGQAGLVVSNAQARFDDVEITGENIKDGGPGRIRPVARRGKLTTTWGRVKTSTNR